MTTERTPQDVLREAIDAALHELGVPDESYPAPVANAVNILRTALDKAIAEAPDSLPSWGIGYPTRTQTGSAPDPPEPTTEQVREQWLRFVEIARNTQLVEAPDTLSEKPGLDVGRLSEAISNVAVDADPNEGILVSADNAEAIAAEYNRLTSTDSEGR